MTQLHLRLLLAAFIVTGCATPPSEHEPIPLTAPKDAPDAAVVRRPMEPTPAPSGVAPTSPVPSVVAPPVALVPLPIPTNILYMCLTEIVGQRQQTAIEFVLKFGELCRRNPEMSPCQYEREVCRRAGGRVFAADGSEITRLTEAEYDKRVLRVRFRAD